MERPDPLHIQVVLTEQMLADRFLAALKERFLPEPFFYWSPLSVRAWLALCRDGPYRNYMRSDLLVRRHGARVVGALPEGSVELISLGSGQGTKDLHLLRELMAAARPTTYKPVDSSQILLEMACANASALGVVHHGLKADLTRLSHLAMIDEGDRVRLFTLVGNTLGAFDPMDMLSGLRSLMQEQDRLLVDGELGHDAEMRQGYENPINRAFAMGPLQALGVQDEHGTLIFEPLPEDRPGFHRLGKSFHVRTDLVLPVGGEPVHLKAGDVIRMNHSGKYDRRGFVDMLTKSGFDPIDTFTGEDGRFLMVLASPRRAR